MIPRVHIGFWPTRDRATVLGAIRVSGAEADVTISNLYPIGGSETRGEVPVAINPDSISQDEETGTRGLTVVQATSSTLANQALSQLSDQANIALTSVDSFFFPAMCTAIGLLLDAKDSAAPCLFSSFMIRACDGYYRGDAELFARGTSAAVTVAQQSGASALDTAKAVFEAASRCEIENGSPLVMPAAHVLSGLIESSILDVLLAKLQTLPPTIPNAPTQFASASQGAPVLPLVSSRLENEVTLLDTSPTERAITAALQSMRSATEAYAVANAVRSENVSQLIDVIAGRIVFENAPSKPPASLFPFVTALLDRAGREMRHDYSSGTIKDAICYVSNLAGTNEDMLRSWARAIPALTAPRVAQALGDIRCHGWGAYQVAIMRSAIGVEKSGAQIGFALPRWAGNVLMAPLYYLEVLLKRLGLRV